MAGYFLALMDINEAEGFAKYSEGGFGSLANYDIEVVAIDDAPDLLEGEPVGQHVVLLRFESKAKVREWYESEAYTKIKGFRQASCKTLALLALDGGSAG